MSSNSITGSLASALFLSRLKQRTQRVIYDWTLMVLSLPKCTYSQRDRRDSHMSKAFLQAI